MSVCVPGIYYLWVFRNTMTPWNDILPSYEPLTRQPVHMTHTFRPGAYTTIAVCLCPPSGRVDVFDPRWSLFRTTVRIPCILVCITHVSDTLFATHRQWWPIRTTEAMPSKISRRPHKYVTVSKKKNILFFLFHTLKNVHWIMIYNNVG